MACLIRLDNGQVFNITNKIDIIGRGSSATIYLGDDGMSRNHAEIFMMSGCIELIDLNSRNGVYVNAKRIHRAFLNSGDKVSIGSVDLIFSRETTEEDNKTINLFDQSVSEIHHTTLGPGKLAGQMELIQVRTDEPYLQSSGTTISSPYLELLFEASLQFNICEIPERFEKVVYDLINVNLNPSLCIIHYNDNNVKEIPLGARKKINKEIFTNTLTHGTAFLHRKKSARSTENSLISCPILDSRRKVRGAIYLEINNKNFEIEDLMFIRALAALAVSKDSGTNLSDTHLNSTSITLRPELLLGHSSVFKQLRSKIFEYANENSILLSGLEGTEREQIALHIHGLSPSSSKVFIYVNCAELDQDAIHEILFGRNLQCPGKFAEAEGGTLMLDCISALPIELQETITEFVKTSKIHPLGQDEPEEIKLKLIVGVRGRIEKKFENETLCRELIQEFHGRRLNIPPLNERPEDILDHVDHYLKKFMIKYNRPHLTLAPESITLLQEHSWPGNIREMELLIERAILCCTEDVLTPHYLLIN
ncbi:MAG: sigma 54-interacting transcriptional regulator [Lentisphaeraceae bacterium]|nr:sigma 54-interacting transcriptional regulator [Lentisphaeraceae bacterium]